MDLSDKDLKDLKKIVPGFFNDTQDHWVSYLSMDDFSWVTQQKKQFMDILEEYTGKKSDLVKRQLINMAHKILPTLRRLLNTAITTQKRKIQRQNEILKRQRLEREQSQSVLVDFEDDLGEMEEEDEYLPHCEEPVDVKPRIPDQQKPETSKPVLSPDFPEIPEAQPVQERPDSSSSDPNDDQVSDLEPEHIQQEGGQAPSWTPCAPSSSTDSNNTKKAKAPNHPPKPMTTNEKILIDMGDIINRYKCREQLLKTLVALDAHKQNRKCLAACEEYIERMSKM